MKAMANDARAKARYFYNLADLLEWVETRKSWYINEETGEILDEEQYVAWQAIETKLEKLF